MKKAKIKMFSLTWEIGDFVQNVSDLDACINKFAGVWSKKMAVQNFWIIPNIFCQNVFSPNILLIIYIYFGINIVPTTRKTKILIGFV